MRENVHLQASRTQQERSNKAHLSPLHSMLAGLEVQTDAQRLNAIVNDLSVFPWVADTITHGEAVDLGPLIQSPGILGLLGTHGGGLFHCLGPGIYEGHSLVLPQGRGRWALWCGRACLHWMFTRTDCMEMMMRCPRGNLAVLALSRALGGTYRFTNPRGWIKNGEPISAEIYSLLIQDWIMRAPGLVERGQWFHRRLEAEFKRLKEPDISHPDDPVHDRYVGAACEMLLGGSPGKAVILYNRWAAVAGYAPIAVAGINPLTIDIGSAILEVKGEDFTVTDVRSRH